MNDYPRTSFMPSLRSGACVALILLATACATTPDVPPETRKPPSPRIDALVDPVLGWERDGDPRTRAASAAWEEFRKGWIDRAERAWQELASSPAQFPPALLGLAAAAIERVEYDRAESLIARATAHQRWLASDIYSAQLARLRGDIDSAVTILSTVIVDPLTPARIRDVYRTVQADYIADLSSRARMSDDPLQRIALLERALEAGPISEEGRRLLVRAHLSRDDVARARETLQPLLGTGAAAQNETQAVLADIEAAEGNFTAAMRRLERLVEVSDDPRFRTRLEEVKVAWHESTLPPRFHEAVSSPALTREQLAILLFWKVPAVRFARQVSQPPIAVDLQGVRGREEMVRALALDLLSVDPSSRRARPSELIRTSRFIEVAAAVIRLSRPVCSNIPMVSARTLLSGCGIDTSALGENPDDLVEGETASAILNQIVSISPAG
ncbi:MAG: hypothetical protein KY459_06140 [Acidobacteria bacterium]|nr:hypothetical protein [Acidobacteriota bacterium]